MAKHTKRYSPRKPAKRAEELMNHPAFKYTFVNPIR